MIRVSVQAHDDMNAIAERKELNPQIDISTIMLNNTPAC